MSLEVMIEMRDEYAAALRRWSLAQVELWRQVPWAALQADGRGGWNEKYAMAYRHRRWWLRSSESHGHYGLAVDLGTGEIWAGAGYKDRLPLEWELVGVDPEELDAGLVLSRLRDFDDDPLKDHSRVYNGYERGWREKRAKELGITEKGD